MTDPMTEADRKLCDAMVEVMAEWPRCKLMSRDEIETEVAATAKGGWSAWRGDWVAEAALIAIRTLSAENEALRKQDGFYLGIALMRTQSQLAKTEALAEALRAVAPYLNTMLVEDDPDDESVGWEADGEGGHTKPIDFTMGQIRKVNAALAAWDINQEKVNATINEECAQATR